MFSFCQPTHSLPSIIQSTLKNVQPINDAPSQLYSEFSSAEYEFKTNNSKR